MHAATFYFLFVRNFDSYSNSVLEGTNCGVKYCENGVRPNMSIAKSTKLMIDQDREKAATMSKKVADSFLKTPLYTNTATSKQLVQVAESHLQNEIMEIENYVSIRVLENKFWVMRSNSSWQTTKDTVIPKFRRVRVVTVDGNGKMKCTCGSRTHRTGIPDRHVVHVAQKFGKDFQLFTHHDVDPTFLGFIL